MGKAGAAGDLQQHKPDERGCKRKGQGRGNADLHGHQDEYGQLRQRQDQDTQKYQSQKE